MVRSLATVERDNRMMEEERDILAKDYSYKVMQSMSMELLLEVRENLSKRIKRFPNTSMLESWHAALAESCWDIQFRKMATSITRIDTIIASRKGNKKAYDPEEFELIKKSSNFLEQFTAVTGIDVHKPGNPIMIKCPFKEHRDGSPSFAIYRRSNSFHCFGCGKSGSMVDFIMEYNKVPLASAIKMFLSLCK